MKKVIYTSITDDYDQLQKQPYVSDDYDYFCFTNTKIKPLSPWQIRPLNYNQRDNIRNSRWHKLHPHLLFPEYQESLWLDGNIKILSPVFFSQMRSLQKNEFMRLPPHDRHQNLQQELQECLKTSKDDANLMRLQLTTIKHHGFSGDYHHGRFFETNVIWRRHHQPLCKKVMNDWWWWLEHYSRRDQLSLTYVLWKNKIDIKYLFAKTLRSSDLVSFVKSSTHQTLAEMQTKIISYERENDHLRQEQAAFARSIWYKIWWHLANNKRKWLELK
jgi:hypothetical protein